MLSIEQAKDLQSQIMKLAHTYKTGHYVDRNAIKRAADEIAQRNGYVSGMHLQRKIGERTTRSRKQTSRQASAQQPAENKASSDVIERYIKLIHDNRGLVPLDWILLRDWTDVTATELRHARKAVIARGYKQIKAKGEQYVFHLPEQTKQMPPATNGVSVPEQPALPLDSDDVVSLLRIMAAKLDNLEFVVRELRQLRAIEDQILGITQRAWK